MKLIIVDESELSNRGTIHITNWQMENLVSLLEKWGIDFEAFQQSVHPTGLNATQKEEVRQMIQSALDTGSA